MRPVECFTPEVLTRAPTLADLEALVRIDAGWTGQERRAYLRSRLSRALRPTGISLARVAELHGEIVGFVLGELTAGEFGRVDATAWIDTIGVKRDSARRGVGTALLDDFTKHARAAGAERVRTLLDPQDEALTEFLEAHAFRMAETRVVELGLVGGRT